MTGAQTLPSFINKGQPKAEWPDWLLSHTVGRPEVNGSFLIKTKIGSEVLQSRVHAGAIVFERNGIAYTCLPDAARALIAEMDEAEKPDPKNATVAAPPSPKPFQMRTVSPPPVKVSAARKYRVPKGMPPSIELRPPESLSIDDSYQRSTDTGPSRTLINQIANDWDWRMCLPLVVSKREDGFYVIDGQHRLAAALLRRDIPFLPCCVHVFDSVAKEAEMFVAMNRARRAINRLDDFHAAEASGDVDVLAIKAMVEGVGFTVSRKTGSAAWAPGEVAFTSAIAKGRRRHGDVAAQAALDIMAEAFAGQRLVVGSPVFTAICAMMQTGARKRELVLKAVQTFDMSGWASLLGECKGGTDRNRHLHEFLAAAYADAEKAA